MWRLNSVNGGREPGDSVPTLELTASEIRGFGGCRRYTGTYNAVGNRISVSSITMATTECHRGNSANRREGDFTTDLSEVVHYVHDGNRLELETASGRRLVFTKVAGRR
jgi:heat shock protein HslJ